MAEYSEAAAEAEIPLLMTVPEAAGFLRIGRNKTYDLVRCGALRSIRIGRQLRVPRDAILDFLHGGN